MWAQLTRWHNYNLRGTVYVLLLLMWLGNGEYKEKKREIAFRNRNGPEELTSLTFNDELFEGSPVLVGFVYPDHMCEPCKLIREMFSAAEYTLATHDTLMKDEGDMNKPKQRGKKVKVRTIDCMKDRAICRRFRISGCPSIAFFDFTERWPLVLAPGAGLIFRRMFFWKKDIVSHDMLVDFALKGYREVDPLPWFAGPFGPAGQIRGLFIRIGAAVHSAGGHLLDKGYSSWFVAAIMVFAGGFATFCVIIFAHMFSRKEKHD